VVTASARWANPLELHVRLTILKGFHINSHDAGASKDLPLVPTTLSVVGEAGRSAAVDYPTGEEQSFSFARRPIRVYSGEVEMVVRLSTAPQKGSVARLNLSYQPCDESACLPPVTKQVEVAV